MSTTPATIPAEPSKQLFYEIEQFCNLLARIYARCLQEQNPQALARLGETPSTSQEVNHVAA